MASTTSVKNYKVPSTSKISVDKLLRVGFYDLEKTIGKGNFAVVKLASNIVTKSKQRQPPERLRMKLIEKKVDGNKPTPTYSDLTVKSGNSSNVTIASHAASSSGGGVIPKCRNYTKLLCELTRLKAQQKYLECNQINLLPENFMDNVDTNNTNNASNAYSACDNNTDIVGLINEINVLKSDLNNAFLAYHQELQKSVKDFYCSVKEIKEDVFKPQRLRQFSVNNLRERTIGIHTQLERLRARNINEITTLRDECEKLENETKILIK
ncbi:hypothetical protein GQX74_012018 [Glossina fuscipes]|nr:hypothetical protein GQX74_012018 [Glossina fuscipes]